MKTAFISGHIDVDEDTFISQYKDVIDIAIQCQHKFVIGSARGVDTHALNYLLKNNVLPSDITIHYYNKHDNDGHMQFYKELKVNIMEHFISYSARDAHMTQVSDYDIAFVRSAEDSQKLYGEKYNPKKKSGTELNLLRRHKNNPLA